MKVVCEAVSLLLGRFDDMSQIVRLRYEGHPRGASLVAQELNAEGLDARIEDVIEKRSGGLAELGVLYLTVKVGDLLLEDALEALIDRARREVAKKVKGFRLDVLSRRAARDPDQPTPPE